MSEILPTVSIVIPAKDAADSLPRALESIRSQTYPNIVEVIVAAADEATANTAGDVRVVRNPSGTTPAGLNLAIGEATGEIVVRCDSHAELPREYIGQAVATLTRTGAANVGGMQVPVGTTIWERVIAAAMTSRVGSGDARYRRGGEAGPAETVYLGVFPRQALLEVGGFDESFVRNQDYELNHRLIASGETVWFDPELKVTYTPRGSLMALAKQYFRYGQSKARFSRKYPGSLRLRQVLPPVTTVVLAVSVVGSVAFRPLWFVPASYVAVVTAWSLLEGSELGLERLLKPLALGTMHLSWGTGFLTSAWRRGS